MSEGLDKAIVNHYQQLEQRARESVPAFVEDPDLETLGAKLDQLRAEHPGQYAAFGLASDKARVSSYRNRKLNADRKG